MPKKNDTKIIQKTLLNKIKEWTFLEYKYVDEYDIRQNKKDKII